MLTASVPAGLDRAPSPWADRLPLPWADEASQVERLKQQLQDKIDWGRVRQLSEPWVRGVRRRPPPFWALDSLLREFPLSSAEGLALMRLAEALLRIPDQATALELLSSQLDQVHGRADNPTVLHRNWSAEASLKLLEWAGKLLPGQALGEQTSLSKLLHRTTERLGSPAVLAAATRALQLLGRQFVLGEDMLSAVDRAQVQTAEDTQRNLTTRHSFDMLGEGARSWDDADRYFAAYQEALHLMASVDTNSRHGDRAWGQRQGISVKLSALHPRFEPAHVTSVMSELVPRLVKLIQLAHAKGLMLTIDAEESFRLELQLAVLEAVLPDTSGGLGLAIQAYQHRALDMITAVMGLARKHGQPMGIRLVKGAYWDSEIKRAQELGLAGYPVYTNKAHTDLAYLACADVLLAHTDCIYPQFATHNATTIAAVLELIKLHGVEPDRYEWQRLQGMGEALYREVRQTTPSHMAQAPLRIYAPVGAHRDLLAYLVRRLLENGANSSFVHQLSDPAISLDELLGSPWLDASGAAAGPDLPLPPNLFGQHRHNAMGRDLQCQAHREGIETLLSLPAQPRQVARSSAEDAQALMLRLHTAWPDWEMTPVAQRCDVLNRAAQLIESEFDSWVVDLMQEARKTMADAVAEVRETIDLARYYAQQGRQHLTVQALPGPTGESNEWQLRARGVFVCIAPWNFPLAIFGGQVMGALVCGNAVAAKPAEQTPAIGLRFMQLLERAGAPSAVLGFAHGAGDVVGAALVASRHCAGVAFTGSVATAKRIQRMLALGDRPIIPLIAETGGLNAMVVDSSAQPEQVVDAVISSAFLSAGQRCSALRLLCLHTACAERTETLLAGAMQTLRVGDARCWHTDVGPVIDTAAQEHLLAHLADLHWQSLQPGSGVRLIAQAPVADRDIKDMVAPAAWALPDVRSLTEEHFGPIVHVVRWGPGTSAPDLETLMAQINGSGYGLTLGIQTRIDRRARQISQLARVGNVYVNRPMTGAVVGSQPFGGQGWSGTGPKAGGPHYLLRFCTEQVLSINTAAAGGNAALLMQMGRST